MPEYAKMEKDIIFLCARHEKNKLPLKCAEYFLFALLVPFVIFYCISNWRLKQGKQPLNAFDQIMLWKWTLD